MLQLNKHGQAKRIKQRAEVEREDEVGPLGILSPISGVSFLFLLVFIVSFKFF